MSTNRRSKRKLPRIIHENYVFCLDSRYHEKERQRFVCKSSYSRVLRCSCILWKNPDGSVTKEKDHYHEEHCKREIASIENEINFEMESNDSARNICNKINARVPNTRFYYTENKILRRIYNKRYKNRPVITDDASKVTEVLRSYWGLQNYYQTKVVANDFSIAWIYGSNKLIEKLESADEIFIDTTIWGIPNMPIVCSQILTIHIRCGNKGFPIIHALCEKRNKYIHEKIFQWLLNEFPGLKENLKTVVTDIDETIISAIDNVMSWVKKRFSWMNFIRYITKKWHSFELQESTILNMVYAIPLMSKEDLPILMENIRCRISSVNDPSRLTTFYDFLTDFVENTTHCISLSTMPHSIYNIIEDYNQLLLSRLEHMRTDFFKFCSKFRKIIGMYEKDWNNMMKRQESSKKARVSKSELERTITELQKMLMSKRIEIDEFVQNINNMNSIKFAINQTISRRLYEDESLDNLHDNIDYTDPAPFNDEVTEIATPQEEENDGVSIEDDENNIELWENPLDGDDDGIDTSWIYRAVEGLEFSDSELSNSDENPLCLSCLSNKAKAFYQNCQHICVCLECKYIIELDAERNQTDDSRKVFNCIVCRQSSFEIVRIVEEEKDN